MWSPTHVQITVGRVRNIKTKGKSGTNDAYVSIKLGKEKYQTSVRERSKDPEWHEKCEFPLQEKHSVLKLKVLHRNLLGLDDVLGCAKVALDELDVHERPKSRWYMLKSKSDSKAEDKYRGEIEVIIEFLVQNLSGSQMSLNKAGKARKLSFKESPDDKTGGVRWPSLGRSFKSSTLRDAPQARESGNLPRMSVGSVTSQFEGEDPAESERRLSAVSEYADSGIQQEDDGDVDEVKKSGVEVKLKKGFFASKLAPLKSKNKQLQKMSRFSQSTLGIFTSRQSISETEDRGMQYKSSEGSNSSTSSVAGDFNLNPGTAQSVEERSTTAQKAATNKEASSEIVFALCSAAPSHKASPQQVSDDQDEFAWHLSHPKLILNEANLDGNVSRRSEPTSVSMALHKEPSKIAKLESDVITSSKPNSVSQSNQVSKMTWLESRQVVVGSPSALDEKSKKNEISQGESDASSTNEACAARESHQISVISKSEDGIVVSTERTSSQITDLYKVNEISKITDDQITEDRMRDIPDSLVDERSLQQPELLQTRITTQKDAPETTAASVQPSDSKPLLDILKQSSTSAESWFKFEEESLQTSSTSVPAPVWGEEAKDNHWTSFLEKVGNAQVGNVTFVAGLKKPDEERLESRNTEINQDRNASRSPTAIESTKYLSLYGHSEEHAICTPLSAVTAVTTDEQSHSTQNDRTESDKIIQFPVAQPSYVDETLVDTWENLGKKNNKNAVDEIFDFFARDAFSDDQYALNPNQNNASLLAFSQQEFGEDLLIGDGVVNDNRGDEVENSRVLYSLVEDNEEELLISHDAGLQSGQEEVLIKTSASESSSTLADENCNVLDFMNEHTNKTVILNQPFADPMNENIEITLDTAGPQSKAVEGSSKSSELDGVCEGQASNQVEIKRSSADTVIEEGPSSEFSFSNRIDAVKFNNGNLLSFNASDIEQSSKIYQRETELAFTETSGGKDEVVGTVELVEEVNKFSALSENGTLAHDTNAFVPLAFSTSIAEESEATKNKIIFSCDLKSSASADDRLDEISEESGTSKSREIESLEPEVKVKVQTAVEFDRAVDSFNPFGDTSSESSHSAVEQISVSLDDIEKALMEKQDSLQKVDPSRLAEFKSDMHHNVKNEDNVILWLEKGLKSAGEFINATEGTTQKSEKNLHVQEAHVGVSSEANSAKIARSEVDHPSKASMRISPELGLDLNFSTKDIRVSFDDENFDAASTKVCLDNSEYNSTENSNPFDVRNNSLPSEGKVSVAEEGQIHFETAGDDWHSVKLDSVQNGAAYAVKQEKKEEALTVSGDQQAKDVVDHPFNNNTQISGITSEASVELQEKKKMGISLSTPVSGVAKDQTVSDARQRGDGIDRVEVGYNPFNSCSSESLNEAPIRIIPTKPKRVAPKVEDVAKGTGGPGNQTPEAVDPDLAQDILKFLSSSREDLVKMIIEQKKLLQKKEAHILDLEAYIDNLILKVIDVQPKLLLTSGESANNGELLQSNQEKLATFDGPVIRHSSPATIAVQSSQNNRQTKEKVSISFSKQSTSTSSKTSVDKKSNPFQVAFKTVRK